MWEGKTTRKLNINVESIVLYARSSNLFLWLFAMIRTKNNAFLHGRHRKKHNGSPQNLSNFLYLLLWRSNTHIESLMSLPLINNLVKTHLLDSFLTLLSLFSRFSLVIPRLLPSTQQLFYAPFLLPIGKLFQARKTICDQERSLKDKVVENCDCAFNADAGFASFQGCVKVGPGQGGDSSVSTTVVASDLTDDSRVEVSSLPLSLPGIALSAVAFVSAGRSLQ